MPFPSAPSGAVAGTVVSASRHAPLVVSVTTLATALGALNAVVTVGSYNTGSAVEVQHRLGFRGHPVDVGQRHMPVLGTLRYALANVQGSTPITFASSLSGSTIVLSTSVDYRLERDDQRLGCGQPRGQRQQYDPGPGSRLGCDGNDKQPDD